MNMTLNSHAPTPAAHDAAAVTAALPDVQPAASAAPAVANAPAAFAQWLGLGRQADAAVGAAAVTAALQDADADAGAAAVTAALPDAQPAAGAALLSDAAAPVAESADTPMTDALDSAGQPAAPAQQDVILLAAMSMPSMAPPQVPAFIRGASVAAADLQGADGAAAALPLSAAELRTGLATAAIPAFRPGGAADALPAATGARPVPVQPAAVQVVSAQVVAAQVVSADARTTATAQPAALATDARPADAAPAADDSAAPAADRPAGAFGVGVAAPAPARVRADSVALAGPPAAWRQTLHEALGERLNLQLSNRAEHAVIRLEPPMLGRIDIAIRHSAGALEVTITATHGEVLRQLHAVSENLRGDLAQRQFTEVAVTVAQAARGAQAAPHGEQQGRGRQPARDDQPQDPGRSLAEAGDPSSTFSLNGRA